MATPTNTAPPTTSTSHPHPPNSTHPQPNQPKVDTTISHSEAYVQFRAAIPQNKISVSGSIWKFFDYGPKNVEPLICLHGTAGTADFFFYQILALGGKGYRIISVQYPPYWTHHEWVMGFSGFLEQLGTEKVHILGQGLGAFLALHWTVIHPTRVSSLILCNGFWDTEPFHQSKNCLRMFHYLPEFALKKYILDSLPSATAFPDTIDFVVEQVELLTRTDVGARLTLNCLPSHIPGAAFDSYDQTKVTILDTTDEIVLPEAMRERLYDKFHNARYALLKHGGDFPFLSIPDEINLHIQIHLRTHGVFPTDSESIPSSNPTPALPHVESKQSDDKPIPALPKSNSTSNTSTPTAPTTSSPSKPTFFLPLTKKPLDDTKRKPRETSYHDEDEKALAQEEEDRERMRRLAQQDGQHTQTLPRTTQSVEDLDAIASARERIRKEKIDKEEKRKRLEEAIAQEKLEREQQEKQRKEEEDRQRLKQQSILSALVPDESAAARTSPDDLF